MIDWVDYKEKLFQTSLDAMKEVIEGLDEGARVSSIFYMISPHWYSSNYTVEINIWTDLEKVNWYKYKTQEALSKANRSELTNYCEKRCTPKEYLSDFCDGGQEIAFFDYPFDYDAIKDDKEQLEKNFFNQIKSSIETQVELSKSEFMKRDEISDLFEFCYAEGDDDVAISAIVLKSDL